MEAVASGRALRVAFFGELGSGNTGNDGSFEVALNWVRRGVPDADILSICRGPEQVTARFGIPAVSMQAPSRAEAGSRVLRVPRQIGRKLRDPLWVYRQLRDTDWVIVPGAGVLESTWARPWALPYALYGLTLAARARGTRVALVNVGADRANSKWTRRLVAGVARKADYLTLRDQHSVKSLTDLHVDVGPDRVYPDLAFGLPRPADESPRPGRVGVGLINYFDWRGSPAQKAANRGKYEEIMIDLVGWLLDEGYSVRLLTGDIWDDPYLQRVLHAVRSNYPDLGPERLVGEPARNLHELMRQMRDVEVVIGARFHNIITALRLAKPIVALSYAPKASQAMHLFGVSSFDHRLDEIDIPRLKQQFRELYQARDQIGCQLRIAFSAVEARLKAQEESFVSEFLLNLVSAAA